MEGRILAIDYGTRRMGLALSDPLRITTSSAGFIERVSGSSDGDYFALVLAEIGKLIEEKEVVEILLGLPKNMDGSLGPMAERVQTFSEKLISEFSLPVTLWDERLTSAQSQREMISWGMSRKKRKKRVDSMAAQLLLQNYLNRLSR